MQSPDPCKSEAEVLESEKEMTMKAEVGVMQLLTLRMKPGGREPAGAAVCRSWGRQGN